MSKAITLDNIPVIKELVEAAIDEKTTPLEDEIEDIKKNGDRVHRFLLYDWDDTLIGVVAVPMGYDPRPYINKYVEENLIHPQLRNQTAAQIASRERTDNYRGEYPHTGPDPDDPLRTGGADTVTDGGDYPLTNHLEYCFMGKDLDPEYPYVSGWTEVTAENMADTFTALTTQSDGTVTATEFGPAPTEEGATAPRIVQFDWTQFISGGGLNPVTVRIKACYKRGVWLNYNDGVYTLSQITTSLLTSLNISELRVGITLTYIRINQYGYGVSRVHIPTLKYRIKQEDSETMLRYDETSIDVVTIPLDIQSNINSITFYQLVDTYKASLIGAVSASSGSTEPIVLADVINNLKWKLFQEQLYARAAGQSINFSFTYSDFNNYNLRNNSGAVFTSASQATMARSYIKKFITAGIAAGQTDAYSYTYYQYQYAIMTKGTGSGNNDIVYLTPDDAETYCKANYEWCQNGGDEAAE